MDRKNFGELVAIAMQHPGRSVMKPVVEKEILHYDIFYALDSAGLLKDLVFQGGTSLRLCRGSNRFSEDLDFAGGKNFSSSKMAEIKTCIEEYIGFKYGLLVEVKEPKEMALLPEHDGVKVDKWQVSVETAPQQRDLPRQRIKLEIANIPAYTRELVPLRLNYDFLFGYGAVLVNTESIDEVMADKIVAFPSAKNIRYRDIWDLAWLHQQGAKLDFKLVTQKIDDYRIENYAHLLMDAMKTLPGVITGRPFKDQMLRFIDSETIAKTLANPAFLTYLEKTVGALFKSMEDYLKNGPKKNNEPSFEM